MPSFRVVLIGWLGVFGFLAMGRNALAVDIPWVTVGDPGNTGDTTRMKQDGSSGYGTVAYTYLIGKYDVTNAQYAEFLNAKDPDGANMLGLFDSFMNTDANTAGISFNPAASNGGKYGTLAGQANKPIVHVSWYNALRFSNWLNNGQGNGDTESGAYTLTGGQTPSNANSITRNAGAKVFLPSENEWYKAAYYKGGGTNAGYWAFATQHDTAPISGPPGSITANAANYNDKITGYATTGSTGYSTNQKYLTDVGAYSQSPSAYGTFDQTGNVFQWNEALVSGTGARGIRGGSWNLDDGALPSLNRDLLYLPNYANFFIGFRVASIPEPTGMIGWVFGAVVLLRRKKN